MIQQPMAYAFSVAKIDVHQSRGGEDGVKQDTADQDAFLQVSNITLHFIGSIDHISCSSTLRYPFQQIQTHIMIIKYT